MAIATMAANNSLQGLRVLVTRPAGRADVLLTEIATRGGTPIHIPLLAVAALDAQRDAAIYTATDHYFRALDTYRRVIAISVNAVHCALPWLQKYWSDWPKRITWYGIGAATIAALSDYGIACGNETHATDNSARVSQQSRLLQTMTSESLLAAADLQQLNGERILILRGVGGREHLAAVLRERGARVDYAECYRRVEPELSAAQRAQLQALEFDAICVNSNETLQNLWQSVSPSVHERARECALIVPSERIADNARQLGFSRVIVAANAGTAATIDALGKIR